MRQLDNKVALIIGATSGIGRATAARFIAEGAHVFATGRRQAELDDLLGTWARLADADILPVMTVDEGLQTTFYYFDPDRNCVELNTNNYGNNLTATEHLQHSPEFAGRPLGQQVDPAHMMRARDAGATPWDLHKRAWQGEFAPETPANPAVLF